MPTTTTPSGSSETTAPSSSGGTTTPSAPSSVVYDGPELVGVTMNGPVDGATVCLYQVTGGVQGALIPVEPAPGAAGLSDGHGCYVTSLDGSFDVLTPDGISGDVLIVATGGIYCSNEQPEQAAGTCASGTLVTVSSTDALSTLADVGAGTTRSTLPLTPLTTAAVDLALAGSGGLTDTSFATDFSQVADGALGSAASGLTPTTLPSSSPGASAGSTAYLELLGQLAGAVVAGASVATQLVELENHTWVGSVLGLPTIDAESQYPLVLENTTTGDTLEIDEAGDIALDSTDTMRTADLSGAEIGHLTIALQPSGATCALDDARDALPTSDLQIVCYAYLSQQANTAVLLSSTTSLAVGSAQCPNGGTMTENGVDANDSGTLDPGEVNAALTTYSCNPVTHSLGGAVYWEGHGPDETVTLTDSNDHTVTDEYSPTARSSFTFATRLDVGTSYDVSVAVQPPDWDCEPLSGAPDLGTVGSADITGLAFVCTWQQPVRTFWSNLEPDHVVRDASGNLYTLADGGDTVYKIAAADGSIAVFTSGLNDASGLAIDTNGNLYVADAGPGTDTGEVIKFSSTGGNGTDLITGLATPAGLTIGPDGDAYVSTDDGALYRVPLAGGAAGTILTAGSGYVFKQMVVDADSTLFGAEVGTEYDATMTDNPVFDPIIALSTAANALDMTSITESLDGTLPVEETVTTPYTAEAGLTFEGWNGAYPGSEITIADSFAPTEAVSINGTIYGPLNGPVPPDTTIPAADVSLIPSGVTIESTTTVPKGAIVAGEELKEVGSGLVATTDIVTLAGATIPAGNLISSGTKLPTWTSITVPAGSVLWHDDGYLDVTGLALDSGCAFIGSTTCALYVAGTSGVVGLWSTGLPVVDMMTAEVPATDYTEGILTTAVSGPLGLVVLSHGDVLAGTTSNTFYEIAPSGQAADAQHEGERPSTLTPTEASGVAPSGVVVGTDGTVYMADDTEITADAPTGVTSTIASGLTNVVGLAAGGDDDLFAARGGASGSVEEFSLREGTRSSVGVDVADLTGIAADAAGDLFLTSSTAGLVEFPVASGGTYPSVGTTLETGDFGGVAVDSSGALFVSDDAHGTVVQVDPTTFSMTTIAGTGTPGFADGLAADAQFDGPRGIAVDSFGDLYVADTGNNAVRKISAPSQSAVSRLVETFAGPPSCLASPTINECGSTPSTNITGVYAGEAGYADGETNSALFDGPTAIALDTASTLYVADSGNGDVRAIPQAPGTIELASLNLDDSVDAFRSDPSASATLAFIEHNWTSNTTDTMPSEADLVDYAWNLCLASGTCITAAQAMSLVEAQLQLDPIYYDIIAAWPAISASGGWPATTTSRTYCTSDYTSDLEVHAAPMRRSCQATYSVTVPKDVAQIAWYSVSMVTSLLDTADLLKGLLSVLQPTDPGYGTTLVQALSDLGNGCETASGSSNIFATEVHPISCGFESFVLFEQTQSYLAFAQWGATLSPAVQSFEHDIVTQILEQESASRNQFEHDFNQLQADNQATAGGASNFSLGQLDAIDAAPTDDMQQGLQSLMLSTSGSGAVDQTAIVLSRLLEAVAWSGDPTAERVAFEEGFIPGATIYDPSDTNVALGTSFALAGAATSIAGWAVYYSTASDVLSAGGDLVPKPSLLARVGLKNGVGNRAPGSTARQAKQVTEADEEADAAPPSPEQTASEWENGDWRSSPLTNTDDSATASSEVSPLSAEEAAQDTAEQAVQQVASKVGNVTANALQPAEDLAPEVADALVDSIAAWAGPIGIIVGAAALIGSVGEQQAEADDYRNSLQGVGLVLGTWLQNQPSLSTLEGIYGVLAYGNPAQMQVALINMVAQ